MFSIRQRRPLRGWSPEDDIEGEAGLKLILRSLEAGH